MKWAKFFKVVAMGAMTILATVFWDLSYAGEDFRFDAEDAFEAAKARTILQPFRRGMHPPPRLPNYPPYPYGRYYRGYGPNTAPGGYGSYPVTPAGSLLVQVVPAGAEVYVNGHRIQPGAGGNLETGLLTGRHKLEVQASGYHPYVREVDIQQGRREVVSVRLTPR